MNAKILVVALLAFSLLFLGCAKRGGETPGAPAAPGGGAGGEQPAGQPSGGEAPAGTVAPPEQDLGGLFNVDTEKPEEGAGFEIPAAGE
ncbi:MAG: hypothetical protein AB1657_01150 [Candidatus Micrarchaeota archaeon]